MATASQVSENPLDYLTMILYVRRGHAVCDQLQLQVAKRMDVLVQDVDQLDGQAPPWLLGVPTAVLLPGREVLYGTQALHAVEALCTRDVPGVEAHVGFGSAGAPLDGCSPTAPETFASLFVCEGDDNPSLAAHAALPLGRSGRYEDAPREKKNDLTLQDALRLREGPKVRLPQV